MAGAEKSASQLFTISMPPGRVGGRPADSHVAALIYNNRCEGE